MENMAASGGAEAARPMPPPHEEVIIDDDSTEDEEDEEVRIVTPQSRKRRRTSAIMMDEDDESEMQENEDEETKAGEESQPSAPSKPKPARQQRLILGRDSLSSQPMTLRTPTPVRRSRRNMQQLSISAAVQGAVQAGERGRRPHRSPHEPEHAASEEQDEDDDDDVQIIQPPVARSDGGSGRKSRRLTIEESDDEAEHEGEPSQSPQRGESSSPLSASRRSSRIERKRQEKQAHHTGARTLEYPVLDNCLETLHSARPQASDGDADEYEENGDFEAPEPPSPVRRRRQPLPRVGERYDREKVYADGGEDLDDFLVADDQVEYMDDDDEPIISVESSGDEGAGAFDDQEDVAAMMEVGRTRELSEWFKIYLEYLEASILDTDLDNKMNRKRSKPRYQLYMRASERIEKNICGRRDTLRGQVAWPEDMVEALKYASQYRSSQVAAKQDCEACNRRQHVATYHVDLAGVACDATKLYSNSWMRRMRKEMEEAEPVQMSFEMGSVCHARTLLYWQLLHAKQFWCVAVDAKMKENGDSSGRIAEQHREPFFKQEFGRFKRLTNLVEKFAEDSKRLNFWMPNVWKKMSRRFTTSDFLPLPTRHSAFANGESRRGTIDSFVADSDEEEEEDEEAVMEAEEEEKRLAAAAAAEGQDQEMQVADTDDEETKGEEPQDRRTSQSESKRDRKIQQHIKQPEEVVELKDDTNAAKERPAADLDLDDLKCLLCKANRRDAAIVHGMYLHVYCCYACAKRQFRAAQACLVCGRGMDRVLLILPLSKEARKDIVNHIQS